MDINGEDILKIKKRLTIYRTIMLASIFVSMLIFVVGIMLPLDGAIMQSANSVAFTAIGTIMGFLFSGGIITFIVFLILTINQKSKAKSLERVSSSNTAISKAKSQVGNNSSNAIVSFVCGMVPVVLIAYCVFVSGGSSSENGAGAVWWLFAIYCWTLGLPLALTWLICGILGLRSSSRRLAIISLSVLPIVIFLLFLIGALFSIQ